MMNANFLGIVVNAGLRKEFYLRKVLKQVKLDDAVYIV